jgi:hypothetical protein
LGSLVSLRARLGRCRSDRGDQRGCGEPWGRRSRLRHQLLESDGRFLRRVRVRRRRSRRTVSSRYEHFAGGGNGGIGMTALRELQDALDVRSARRCSSMVPAALWDTWLSSWASDSEPRSSPSLQVRTASRWPCVADHEPRGRVQRRAGAGGSESRWIVASAPRSTSALSSWEPESRLRSRRRPVIARESAVTAHAAASPWAVTAHSADPSLSLRDPAATGPR